MITNLSVVLLTGIAGQLGKATAIGYALGAQLECILIPVLSGSARPSLRWLDWGAGQYRRAREIAWAGAGAIAATSAVIGICFAIFPTLWLGIFSDAEDIIALGTSFLQVVAPIYSLYGLGMGLRRHAYAQMPC
jgi:Na+-driven multidrug efflux pump